MWATTHQGPNKSSWNRCYVRKCLSIWIIGRSDFPFFRFSKMSTLLSVVYIFMSSFQKYRRISPCAAKFSFSKNHRDLENEYIFFYFQKPSFYIKEQLSKIEFKIRICLVFFFFKNSENENEMNKCRNNRVEWFLKEKLGTRQLVPNY